MDIQKHSAGWCSFSRISSVGNNQWLSAGFMRKEHQHWQKIGNYLSFSFMLKNSGKKKQNTRIEYSIYYLLQNGNHYKKVFKISERQLAAGEKMQIEKQHNFKLITPLLAQICGKATVAKRICAKL
jgi:hypothetical protein